MGDYGSNYVGTETHGGDGSGGDNILFFDGEAAPSSEKRAEPASYEQAKPLAGALSGTSPKRLGTVHYQRPGSVALVDRMPRN
jgi:hypothetical protein